MTQEQLTGLEVLNPVDIRPLKPADIDVGLIRSRLAEGDIKLDITEAERATLSLKPFLTLHEGRGIGVKAALGDKAVPFLNLSYELMNPDKKLTQGNAKSPSRGMHQFVADLLELALNPSPTLEDVTRFCDRTNERVRAGYTLRTRPESFRGLVKPDNAIASVPPDSIPKIWHFLTTPNNRVE